MIIIINVYWQYSNQQSNTWRYLVYHHRKLRKPGNIHIWEAGTSELMAFCSNQSSSVIWAGLTGGSYITVKKFCRVICHSAFFSPTNVKLSFFLLRVAFGASPTSCRRAGSRKWRATSTTEKKVVIRSSLWPFTPVHHSLRRPTRRCFTLALRTIQTTSAPPLWRR